MDRRTVRGRTKSVMKTIGIVAEGPRDFELIAAVIDTKVGKYKSFARHIEMFTPSQILSMTI